MRMEVEERQKRREKVRAIKDLCFIIKTIHDFSLKKCQKSVTVARATVC